MNVVFRVAGGDEKVEKTFAQHAEAARIVGTVGHRSVGGMRVSLSNAVAVESVQTLVSFHAGIRTHARLANLRAGERLLKCHQVSMKYQGMQLFSRVRIALRGLTLPCLRRLHFVKFPVRGVEQMLHGRSVAGVSGHADADAE